MLAAGLATVVGVAGCTSDDSSSPEPTTETEDAPATGESMDLDVLVYNIEYGGDATTDAVMRSLDADIVGVLESYNRLPEIARKTGYPYYNVGLQLLSKYPIHEPSGADGLYALVEVQPGYAVAFFNTHLDYVAYGPRLLSSGMSVRDVIASENEVRTSSMQILLPHLVETADAGYPTFLTGDFNQPSSLDYTSETVGTRDGVDRVVRWPVSEALLAIDFSDAFRDVHPDPVADPGLTHDNPDFRGGGSGDRIDYVYSGGPVETLDSQLVGETGDPDVDIGFEKWTSDHRAVLSSFELQPLALPTTVSLDRRMLTQGDELTVYPHAPGVAEPAVTVVPEGGDPSEAETSQSPDEAGGTISFDTAEFHPGGYDIVLLDDAGEVIARNEFWVRSREADVHISTDRRTYDVGEPIDVAWENGPANRWDWIGLYHADASDPETDDYLLWGYTGGHDSGAIPPSVSGSMTLDDASPGRPWPLLPGDYVVHYLLTDQYESAGSAAFTVTR
jgi:endonuclease/exonuclease/phosphatase family metal-dependent hydrolase